MRRSSSEASETASQSSQPGRLRAAGGPKHLVYDPAWHIVFSRNHVLVQPLPNLTLSGYLAVHRVDLSGGCLSWTPDNVLEHGPCHRDDRYTFNIALHNIQRFTVTAEDKNEQLVITCVDHSTLPTMTLIRGMAKTLLVSILDERLCAVVGPMPSFDADHYEVQVSRPVRTMSAPGGAASASSKPAAGPKPHSSVPCNPPCEQCQYLPNTPASPTVFAIYMNRALRGLYSALGMPQQRGPRNVEAIIAEWDERRRQRTLRRSFFELRAHVARKRRLHSRLTELLRRDQLPFEMIPASGSMTPDAISADHDLTDGPGQWAAEELAADMDLLRRGLAQGADVQPLAPLNMRGPPLAELNADADDDTWLQDCYRHFGADGFRAFCRQVFREGVPPNRRKVVWPLLLGVFSWDSTPKDRSDFCQAVRETYDSINRQVAAQQFGSVGDRAHFHQQVETITLDVQRADRAFHSPSVEGRASDTTERLLRILQAYIFLNRYPGYAQGMSDLAEPLLFVLEDEALTFQALVQYMNFAAPRFVQTGDDSTQLAMQHVRELMAYADPLFLAQLQAQQADHLFFCYRWFLVDFKRDLPPEDVPRAWERLWAGRMAVSMHMPAFVAYTLLQHHREEIMALENSDYVLKYFNDLKISGAEFDGLLTEAHELVRRLRAQVVCQVWW